MERQAPAGHLADDRNLPRVTQGFRAREDEVSAGERRFQRRTWEARAEVTIRLIYFDTIRGPFQQQYGSLIAAGYSAVGLPASNFSGMDRKSALAAIAAFEANIRPSAPAAVAQLRPVLVDGLRGLGHQYTPVNWI